MSTVDEGSCMLSKSDTCPSMLFLRSLLVLSHIFSKLAISVARFGLTESNAPALNRLSTSLLLTSCPETLFTKFWREVNSPPFSLSLTIVSTAFSPTFFIADMANLIFPFSTLKAFMLLFTSGGRTCMPSSLHSFIY